MSVISKRISTALQHLSINDFENALIQICIAIDATSKKKWPKHKPGRRIREYVKEYETLIYQCASGGKLKVAKGGKVTFNWGELPDVTYKLIRCVLLHGDDIHDYVDIRSNAYVLGINQGRFILNTGMIWGLLYSVAVDIVNKGERCEGEPSVFISNQHINLNNLWGNLSLFEKITGYKKIL